MTTAEVPVDAAPSRGDDYIRLDVSFTTDGRVLIVTERRADTISSYLIDERGYAQGSATIKSSGQTPL